MIYIEYYNEIKNELINNEINKRVKNYSINKSDLNTYYNVGKMLSEAGKHYGEGIIKDYSIKLTLELGKGYTFTSLTRMRKFYYLIETLATMSQQLSYGHYVELLPYKDINKIRYYIRLIEEQNLSIRELRKKIKLNEYERLTDDVKNNIINRNKPNILDFVKNPVIIKNSRNYNNISEKILKNIILEDIESFMKELGNSFSFIGSEYKIKIGNSVYMNYIDDNLRKIDQDKTIGIIICKEDNKYIIKYCSDERIISRKYELI